MASSRNNDRVRYRYGICLNDNCEKCRSKEVQEIPARKDFVCQNPECGKPLRECPPPKKGGNKKLIGIIAGVVVLLAIIGGIIAMSGGESKPEPVETAVAPVDSDSIKAAQEAAEQQRIKDSLDAVAAANAAKQKAEPTAPSPKPAAPAASSGSKDLGYATFKGTLRNGKPDDVNGRLIFKTSHVIDSRDPKGRVADAGDYVIGEWSNGHLVQGIWYGADNQVKGSIIIGK
jgi:hypothetical protein